MFERTSRRSNDQCTGLVRAHSSARDRPSERHSLHRPHENTHTHDRREHASILEQTKYCSSAVRTQRRPEVIEPLSEENCFEDIRHSDKLFASCLRLVAQRSLPRRPTKFKSARVL